jgi:hypothetical protein
VNNALTNLANRIGQVAEFRQKVWLVQVEVGRGKVGQFLPFFDKNIGRKLKCETGLVLATGGRFFGYSDNQYYM